jgi:hypothetical protein
MNIVKTSLLSVLLHFIALSGFSQTKDTLYHTPNPFETTTVIHFDVSKNDTVTLHVYDMLGRIVASYYENFYLLSGSYSVNFGDATVNEGIYIVYFKRNSAERLVKKIIKDATVTAINNHQAENQKNLLFPNPTKNIIEVPFEGIKTIIITDIAGKALINVSTDEKFISLSELKSGNYIVTVLSEKKELITTQKIIKLE